MVGNATGIMPVYSESCLHTREAKKGHVVFSSGPDSVFQALPGPFAADLRQDGNAGLAALVADAMQGKTDTRLRMCSGTCAPRWMAL